MALLANRADKLSVADQAELSPLSGTTGPSQRGAALPAWMRERLADCLIDVVERRAGQDLRVPEEGENGFYRVLEGVLADTRQTPGGSQRIVAFLFVGDWILPNLSGEHWAATIRALGNARLERFDGQKLRKACSDDPALGYNLFRMACRELSQRTEKAMPLRGFSVDARFAAFLADLARHLGSAEGDGIVVPIPMTRNDIANHLGLRTETLCRIIGRWRKRGLITLEGPRVIHIPDLSEIELMAEDREAA
jgi:CRP/FNR family transcriptional regulator